MYKKILKDFILSSEQSSWPVVSTHFNVPDVILSRESKRGSEHKNMWSSFTFGTLGFTSVCL